MVHPSRGIWMNFFLCAFLYFPNFWPWICITFVIKERTAHGNFKKPLLGFMPTWAWCCYRFYIENYIVLALQSSSSQTSLLIRPKGAKTFPGEPQNSPWHQTSQEREDTVGWMPQLQDKAWWVLKGRWAFPGNWGHLHFSDELRTLPTFLKTALQMNLRGVRDGLTRLYKWPLKKGLALHNSALPHWRNHHIFKNQLSLSIEMGLVRELKWVQQDWKETERQYLDLNQ